MKRKVANGVILLGVVLLLAAAAWMGYNYWDAIRAGKESTDVVDELADRMRDRLGDPSDDGEGSGGADPKAPLPTKRLEDPTRTPYKDMETEIINGYRYIGVLEIPSLGLTLPVMEEWDYTRLQISPCRYSGSYYTDDLVICAHNYNTHLGPIRGISMGADVYFTNVGGETIHYIANNIQTIQPTQIREMTINKNNAPIDEIFSGAELDDWDLTMFTCNASGLTRCAVRCIRE